jgi:hypothetical protein
VRSPECDRRLASVRAPARLPQPPSNRNSDPRSPGKYSALFHLPPTPSFAPDPAAIQPAAKQAPSQSTHPLLTAYPATLAAMSELLLG